MVGTRFEATFPFTWHPYPRRPGSLSCCAGGTLETPKLRLEVQPLSQAHDCLCSLSGACLVPRAVHSVCSNQDALWIPASPAGSLCPSSCCSRPSRWARITLGLLPEVGVLSLSIDPPSCCPCPSPLPHPTMRTRGQHPPHLGWGCPGRSPLCCEISSFGISVAAGVQLILHHVRVHAKYSTACHWCCPAEWEG